VSPRLHLHICFRAQGIRWPLHDDYDVEVWTSGHELVATLPGRLIRHLVEIHLAGATLQQELESLLPPRRLAARLPARPGDTRESRDILRQARRRRKDMMR
jgi:hypothetical protein